MIIPMNWIITTYIIYLTGSAFLTIWVGHTLYENGRTFVVRAVQEEALADAINKMLLIGFYLVNGAYVLLVLKDEHIITNLAQLLELLSIKLGLIVSVLAGMHFFNLLALFAYKNKEDIITRFEDFFRTQTK